MTARLAASVLVLEAFLVFFAVLAAFQLTDLPDAVVWGGGLGLAVACLLVAGVVRRPGGLVAGWVLQLVIVAGGVVLPAMYVLGVLFAGIWWYMLRLGRRVDRERALFVARYGHPDDWPTDAAGVAHPPPGTPEPPEDAGRGGPGAR